MTSKTLWETYSPSMRKDAENFCEGYKQHISSCKTERECVDAVTRAAVERGYKDITDVGALTPGAKVYAVNRGKMLVLIHVGTLPFEQGFNILGAHIDSPRLDLKPNPLYEDSGFAMLKTHYYGGIKKFQWVTLPLALHGVVFKKDGTKIQVVIGEDPQDPVFGISDVLPHLGKDQNEKTLPKAFTGEDLNICFGSIPIEGEGSERVKDSVLSILKDKYSIEEDDFQSAEIEVVPAGQARDYGIDRSMILAYGHDDRICSYTSSMAMLDEDAVPAKTCVTLLVDKEEIGSVGATGMHSRFFENTMAEIMEKCGHYSELSLRKALAASSMLSSDVSAGFDPNYASVHEKNNAPFFGKGPVLHKYTGAGGKSGSNDASAEYIARLRRLFDQEAIQFQMAELGKVDQGGGGTIAYIPAQYAMDVIDLGIPLHSMHAPWEVASKVDIFEAYRAYRAFLKNM